VARRPRVAILIEASRSYGRDLLQGVAEYVRVHGPWSISLDDRGLREPPVWLANWHGDAKRPRTLKEPARMVGGRAKGSVFARNPVWRLTAPLVVTIFG
jgi:LacI family transcriptional regulator